MEARTAALSSFATGVALEFGIEMLTGRSEAWDSAAFWTIGLPAAIIACVGIGFLSRGRAWLGTVFVAPGQVLAMMIRSGEVSGLWPLTVAFSAILSAPFVVAAFIGSRLRR